MTTNVISNHPNPFPHFPVPRGARFVLFMALLTIPTLMSSPTQAQGLEVEGFGGGFYLASGTGEGLMTSPPFGFGIRVGYGGEYLSAGVEGLFVGGLILDGAIDFSTSVYTTLRIPTGTFLTPRFSASLGFGVWSAVAIWGPRDPYTRVLISALTAGVEVGRGTHRGFLSMGAKSMWSRETDFHLGATIRLGWTAQFGRH